MDLYVQEQREKERERESAAKREWVVGYCEFFEIVWSADFEIVPLFGGAWGVL